MHPGLTKNLMVLSLLVTPAFAANLQQKIEAMAAHHHGKVALYAINMKTGATVAINPDRPVATASVIKLPIMVEAYAQVKAGKRRLTDKVTLTKENQVPGSGVLTFLQPGLELTLQDAIVLMMTVSDNTGTNMVIDQVGIPSVNARMNSMGLKNTYLYKKVYKPAEGQLPPDSKQFGLGKTTAREMAEVVETSETPSAIADKIGMLDDVRNDVALIESKSGPIVISAFTYDNKDQSWNAENEAELLIARMSKAIVDAWAPAGLKTGAQEASK